MPIVEFSSIPAQEKMVNVHIHYMLNCKIVHVCADLRIVVGERGGGAEKRGKVDVPQQRGISGKSQAWIQRGGGTGGSSPGKSQVIWGSIGDKQLDPSLEKVDPPHLE